MANNKSVLVPLASGFEELEAITLIDVLRRAQLYVTTASLNDQNTLVPGAHNISIMADTALSQVAHKSFDAIALPGGMPGASNLAQSEVLAQMLKAHHDQGKVIAAICAAPMVLGQLGLLQGRTATCFPGFESKLLGANVVASIVAQDHNIITSQGPGTALPFALAIVEKLCGETVSQNLSSRTLFDRVLA